ncbi:MAG: hypothetical protein SFV81_05930 [Pirellulaceae bacterium]|nr:hypothetical protein [Pirellulaceae bacterium]
MEPFTIQCATCQSLIRVRNPKMIGQIVNCPKCNSMLQVTKPQVTETPVTETPAAESSTSVTQTPQTIGTGTPPSSDGRKIRVESHRGVIDSTAMTKEAFDPDLEDEYRLAPSQLPEPGLHSSSRLVAPPQVNEDPIFEDPFNAPPLPAPIFPKTPPAAQPHGQAATNASESNHIQLLAVQRTARRRQVLMVAVFGSSGVLLAGMLFAGFLYWYTGKASSTVAKKPDQGSANQPNEPKHVGPKREAEQGVQQDPLDALADPMTDPLANPTTPTDSQATDSQATDTQATDTQATDAKATDAKATEGSATPTTESPADPNGKTNSISNAIANAIESTDGAPPNPSNEPLRNDPQPSNQTDGSTEQPPTDVVADENASTELPDQLKKFQNILNLTIEPQFLENQAIQKAPPTAKELGLSNGQGAKALPPVDISAQLQLPITGLIIPPNSISNTISQWVQVSGIPTVVDLDSLVAAGIDRHKSIGKILVSGEAPMGQVAASIAKDIGVDAKQVENFFAFQASEEEVRRRLPTAMKISDLVDNDKQPWLVKTLEQIFPEYEGKWTVEAGELKVDPAVVDIHAWFWAVRMLETWRLAAGIETQLDQSIYDPSKFATKFIDPEQLPALNTPLRLTLVNRAPVAQLISEVATAGKMHAWVDWASVSQEGLGPNTVDFLVTQDRSLRQCFRDLAEKYSLVVACEDDKSLVITTMAVYRAQPRLFVLPSQGKTAEQWMEELQPLTPATAAAAQPIQAYLTPDNQFVIVRCCRPRLRG